MSLPPNPPNLLQAPGVISVSELNRAARELLETRLPLLWVSGELSNVMRAASGHWYFSLKDASAQVRCVMFRHKNQYLDWQPKDGMHVEVRALVTLYEPRGDFQLNVETMRRAGLGALYEAFERLKARLEKEGLFESTRKQALPAFPRQIGVVTSPSGAALHDVLTTLRRRFPALPVIVYPTLVQGESAAPAIAAAISVAGKRAECDVLILCRGGGSIEDLWPFNEEAVARAIAACPIPIVAGVGHETDFTIADFVADQRAPTPTGAAELVTPNRADLLRRVDVLRGAFTRRIEAWLENRMQHLDHLSRRLVHPGEAIRRQRAGLDHLRIRFIQAGRRLIDAQSWRLSGLSQRLRNARPDVEAMRATQCALAERLTRAMGHNLKHIGRHITALEAQLTHLNPHAVMERGYSIVTHDDGRIVRDSAELAAGDAIQLSFARGRADAQVIRRED